MTVRELRKRLSHLPGDRIVVLSADPEGNRFLPLTDVEVNCGYDPEEQMIQILTLTDGLKEQGFRKEDLAPQHAKPCVTLWP